MPHINDVKFETLRSQGYVGALPDMLVAALKAAGAVGEQYNDLLKSFLVSQGYDSPALADAMFDFLRGEGYSGTVSDMMLQFWEAGGYQPLYYSFNGTNQYAIMNTDWTPNGLPFEISVNAVPLTLDGTTRIVMGGATLSFISAEATAYRYRAEIGVSSQTQFGFGVQNEQVQLSATVDGSGGGKIDANGTVVGPTGQFAVGNSGNLYGSIAANKIGTQFWHGPIWDLRLTDNSPIQDTDVVYGNGTRYGVLDQAIVLDDLFDISVDLIRQDSSVGAVANWFVLSDSVGDVDWLALTDQAAAATNRIELRVAGAYLRWDGALDNVALGQHCTIRIVRTVNGVGRDHTLYIDNVQVGSVLFQASPLPLTIDTVGNRVLAGRAIPADSALQNIIIKDLTNNYTFNYPLNEGTGTTITNIDPSTQGNYLDQPLWDTVACFGNGTRYGQLRQPITLAGDFDIEWDQIYTSADQFLLGGLPSESNYIRFNQTTDGINIIIDGTSINMNAFLTIGEGQHIRCRLTRTGTLHEVFVDGVIKNSQTASSGAFTIDQVYKSPGRPATPAGVAFQNIIIKDLTQGLTYEYKLDEGSGTLINNTDPVTGDPDFVPISNTVANFGNGTRYGTIPAITLSGANEWTIRFDGIFTDKNNDFLIGNADGQSSIYFAGGSAGENPPSVNIVHGGVVVAFTGALTDGGISEAGQHYTLEVYHPAGGLGSTVTVNGVTAAVSRNISNDFILELLYGAGASRISANSALQNIIITDVTQGLTYEYKLDEGSGLDIINTDPVTQDSAQPELVTNGDFEDGDTGWTLGSFTTVSGGKANIVGSTGELSLTQDSGVSLKTIQVTYTISDYVGGVLRVQYGNINGLNRSANGTYTDVLTGVGVSSFINFFSLTEDTTLSVDDISVKLVTNGTWTPDTDWQAVDDQSKGDWTPDADWQDTGSYSTDGAWTPDAVWSNVPANSRYYPMNEGGGNILFDKLNPSARTVGDNLVVNGDFRTTDAWVAQNGWVITTNIGAAQHTTDVAIGTLTQILPALTEVGKTYQIEFDLRTVENKQEEIFVGFGDGSGAIDPADSIVVRDFPGGRKTIWVLSKQAYPVFGFAANPSAEVAITNVDVREVQAVNTDAVIQNYTDEWQPL